MKALNPVVVSGREVLPLVEGGKGVAVTTGECSGAWAAAGGVGTVSGVNADSYDKNGDVIPQIYHAKTRRERHQELIEYAIRGGVTQAQIGHETAAGEGRIHINILWEMGGAQQVIEGILEGAKGLVHGVTCGAGMPYKIAEIAANFGVYYYPIISSARAFRALWKRSFSKNAEFLGGVVYEDPWLAGGHNGLTNSEDPLQPEAPYPRVLALRQQMCAFGLDQTPIVMAGGVWYLREWQDWIDNPELGPIVFQFGSRGLLTQEIPIPEAWKQRLMTLREGDILLNRFSPTGFYSSAVHNDFLHELQERNARQVSYTSAAEGDHAAELGIGPRNRLVYLSESDRQRAEKWIAVGNSVAMRTPSQTLIFVSPERAAEIRQDQVDCMGCLSQCLFSNWAENEEGTTGKKSDPRSFCIQKTLQDVMHTDDTENNLMFAGHGAFRFASDPFYSNGFIPTVRQLVERLITGD